MAGPWEKYGNSPTPTPATPPWKKYAGGQEQETDAQRQLRKFSQRGDPNRARNALATAEQAFAAQLDKRNIQGSARDAAFARFRSDPRWKALRQSAGLPPVFTRREQIQDVARRTVAREVATPAGKFGTALKAGITRGLFGIPERLAAAGLYYSGQGGNDYNETLDLVRARTDEELRQSTGGNIIGQVLGSFGGGGVVGNTLKRVAVRGAASTSPMVARGANFLQNLVTLKKGQRAANAGRIVLAGGAGGAAQAAGEGSDVGRGATYGAGGAALLGGGVKAAQVLTRPVRDVLRLTRADQVISRLTGSTTDEIAQRAQAYRDATGAEPTIFELLPLADRNRLLKQGVVGRDAVVEQTSRAIRDRASNLGPEMSRRAQEIVQPQRNFIESGMRGDMARARGGAPDPTDAALVERAARSPTDLLEMRSAEANAIMAPHENTPVVAQLDELFPSVPSPNGQGRIAIDPEVSTVIRSAAGVARQRNPGDPITAGDITDMISTLRADLGKGGIEARTAERAINHLQDVLDTNAPDAGAAAREMSDAFAARSRMAEGMQEGARTRLRDDVQVGTSRREAQRVRNAYDTPEGAAGRTLGQSNRILTDLGGSPDEALRATVAMARGSTGRPMAQNLGTDAAERIGAAARAQDESAQALAAASQKAQGAGGGGNLDGEALVQALVGLHPNSFITTKASAIRTLMDMTYIPEGRARVMVDMLFSQNPDLARRALKALGNAPNGAKFTQYLAGITGMMLGSGANDQAPGGAVQLRRQTFADFQTEQDAPEPDPSEVEVYDESQGNDAAPGGYPVQDAGNLPYGHAVIASLFPEAEITEDVRPEDAGYGAENSYHKRTQNAVDVRPIPGMSFEEFTQRIRNAGYTLIEAIDEVRNPSKGATGPHWHVVIAG
jgi:hypothetical protein